MSATERLPRLLALVPWLSAHDGATIAGTARHFGVSEEQLEKDLWLLVVCGLPGYGPDQLVDIDFWDDGVIRVIDAQTLDRPLRLTADEAVTLLVALRMLAQVPGVEDREAILTAAAKIERVAADAASAGVVAVEVDVPAQVSAAVDEALSERRELSIRYAAATRDEVTDRVIRPERLLVIDGVAYLEAYCATADAQRTFRLDRMVTAAVGDAVKDERSTPEALPSPKAAPFAVLDLDPSARWLIDVHDAVVEGEGASGRTRVRLPLHSMSWGTRLVLSLQGSAVAVSPPELVAEVAQAAEAALAAYPVT